MPLYADDDEAQAMFEKASGFYQAGRYQDAFSAYYKLDSLGYKSGELYFNLGNAAYKTNQIGKSVFYYEKARLFFGQGSDEDTEINLELANLKTADKIDAAPRSFFSLMLGGFLNFFNLKVLAWLVGISTWMFFIFLILETKRIMPGGRTNRLIIRILLLTTMMFFALTFSLKSIDIATQSNAIVLEKSVSLKSEPNQNSKSMFILHEGLKVEVTRKQETWVEVRLPDGNKGWIESQSLGLL